MHKKQREDFDKQALKIDEIREDDEPMKRSRIGECLAHMLLDCAPNADAENAYFAANQYFITPEDK